MILSGKCNVCGNTQKFDIGDMEKEEVIAVFGKHKDWHCDAGKHMEFMSPINMYEFDWNNLEEGSAPSKEEFLKSLRERFTQVLTTKELQEKYRVESFALGMCLVSHKNDENKLVAFNYATAPNGERYYFTNEG